MAKAPVARFGIGEWYGRSFTDLTAAQRVALAKFKPDKKSRLDKAERARLAQLSERAESGPALTAKELARLEQLRAKKAAQTAGNQPCPFKGTSEDPICTKDGGVCSLRMYEPSDLALTPTKGRQGDLRVHCPYRFHEAQKIFRWVATEILGTNVPALVAEVGFLESSATVDSADGEDVGRIDMVLVRQDLPPGFPMQWVALEIQAVYFSGEEMGKEFADIAAKAGKVSYPAKVRRPDYRSSAPKRLMPQLQIKVPTLRRWGKKMAVVIDNSFFDSISKMEEAPDLSNGDIAWFVVKFAEAPGGGRFELIPDKVFVTTLERAIEGLTGGRPVAQEMFQARIGEKLEPGPLDPGGVS